MTSPRVLVVLPVFNEVSTVMRLVQSIQDFQSNHEGYRFLIVDDGSSDGTADVLGGGLDGIRDLGCLRLPDNCGKGGAVAAGFEGAEEEFLLFTDGDLAYSLDLLPSFVDRLRTSEVVIGTRGRRRSDSQGLNVRRYLLGQGFNHLVNLLLGLDYSDTQAGIKGFRRGAAEKIFRMARVRTFSFDAELLFLSAKLGLVVTEEPVQVSADHSYNKSKVRLMIHSLLCLRDVLGIRLSQLLGRYE